MSWVQVECSNGSRYGAPSHGRAVPHLGGVAQLFQPPLSLRRFQTIDLVDADGAACIEYNSSSSIGERMSVVAEQRDLGGHLGMTTVVVGWEHGEEMDDAADAARGASSSLESLVQRVFTILRTTNDRGVSLLLDALCTRAPFPLTAEATARAATVREDDGGPGVSQALTRARAQLPHYNGASQELTKTSSNRHFLKRLTRGEVSPVRQRCRSPLQLLPSNAASAVLSLPVMSARAPPLPLLPLTFATAVRRQALLFFLRHEVVPLSLLAARVARREVSRKGKDTAPQENAATQPSDSAAMIDAETVLLAVAPRIQTATSKRQPSAELKGASSSASSYLLCTSLLRQKSSSAVSKCATWDATAQTAEEGVHLLLLCVVRLLVSQPLPAADVPTLERLVMRELWQTEGDDDDDEVSAQPFHAPVMVAAFTPSGLLVASDSWRRCFSHEEYIVLAAAAIDRLSRASTLPASGAAHSVGRAPCCGGVLRWTSWPLQVGSTGQSQCVVDVLLLTVGDALALYLCFPRGVQSSEPLSSSVVASLSIESVQRLLERTVAAAYRVADRNAANLGTPACVMSLRQSLVRACTHSTAAFSAALHDALFAATAMEAVMQGLRFRDKERLTLPFVDASVRNGAHRGVADELLQLLREHRREGKGTGPSARVSTSPPAGQGITAVHITMPTGAGPTAKRRLGLHKILARLPLSSRMRGSMTQAQRDKMLESVPQSNSAGAPPSASQKEVTARSSGNHKEEVRLETAEATTALLALPLEYMLCYAAALITRNELGVLRRAPEMGLHSFFFLQQEAPTSVAGKRVGAAVRAEPSPQPVSSLSHDSHPVKYPTTAPRFAVSFSRQWLQQPHCPSALLPAELRDAAGMADGQGGLLSFVEDPTLTLHVALQALAHHGEPKPRQPVSTVVSVLPTWSLLHIVPVEATSVPHEVTTTTTSAAVAATLRGGSHDACSESPSSEASDCDGPSCPASLQEEAATLTSLCLALPQRVCRRASTYAGGGGGAHSDPSTLAPAGSSSAQPLPTATRHPLHAAAAGDKVSVVVAVVNVCGDFTGNRCDALLRALRKDGLSKSTGATGEKQRSQGVEDALADRDAIEAEYAAGVAAKTEKLIHEVVLCKEAALAVLEGATCHL